MKKTLLTLFVLCLSVGMSTELAKGEYDYSQVKILADTYRSGKWDGEGWPFPRGGPYYTTIDYLRDLGYTVQETTEPLTNYILSDYHLLLEANTGIDFAQDELNAIANFVTSGGGIIMTVDTGFYYSNVRINSLANLFGIQFVGDFFADSALPSPNMTSTNGLTAWLVNKNTPIGAVVLQGLTEPPETGWGWFVAWDGAPLIYPSTATVLAMFNGQDYAPGGVYQYDAAALVALEYGQGKVLAGPYNGLMQPWTPDTSDIQSKILLNSIAWTTNTPVSTTVVRNPLVVSPAPPTVPEFEMGLPIITSITATIYLFIRHQKIDQSKNLIDFIKTKKEKEATSEEEG